MNASATWFDSFGSQPLFGAEQEGLDDFELDAFESEASAPREADTKIAQIKELFSDLIDIAASGRHTGEGGGSDDDDAGSGGNGGNPQIARIKDMFTKLIEGNEGGGEGGGGNDADHDGGGGKAYVAELTEMFEDLIDGINDGEGGGHGNTGSGGGGGIDAGLFGDIGDLANAEDFGHPHSGLFQVDDLLM